MAPLPGTNVASALKPFDDLDTYATHEAEFGKGGWRSVQTLEERDAIPPERREAGMVVRVTHDDDADNNGAWELQIDGAWTRFAGAGGIGGGVSFQIDGVPVAPVVPVINFEGGNATLENDPSGTGLRVTLKREFADARKFHAQQTLNIEVAKASGSYSDFVVYTPSSPSINCVIHSLLFRLGTLGGGVYSYQLFAGNPTDGVGSRMIFDSATVMDRPVNTFDHRMPIPIVVRASQGDNTIWARVFQRSSYKMVISSETVCTEFVSTLLELPGYAPPPRYSGPLKMQVYVGSNGEFEEPRYALDALHPQGTMFIEEGTYFLPIGVGSVNNVLNVVNPGDPAAGKFEYITIKGAGAYKTVLNGRGGVGNGFGLFYGKGMLYSQSPLLCEDLSIIGGGGADLVSDGEAGAYHEGFVSMAKVTYRHCGFDQNENGIFVPDAAVGAPGEKVQIRFEECDFGLRYTNGMSGDGKDHNFYVSGDLLEVINCHGYGTVPTQTYTGYDAGNTYKARASRVVIQGGYCESGSGRWLDRPKGGQTSVTGVTLSQRPGSNGNIFGYGNEVNAGDPLVNGSFDTYFTNCPIYISRYASVIWNNDPLSTVHFDNCPVTFCEWGEGGTKPTIELQGPGAIVGINDVNIPNMPDPYPLPIARPGSIAQPGYVPSWP